MVLGEEKIKHANDIIFLPTYMRGTPYSYPYVIMDILHPM